MHWIRFSIVLLLVTLLNAGNLLNTIPLIDSNSRPDLLFVLLLFFASNCKTLEAVIASFAIGFAADISGVEMGPHIIAFGLMGSAISQMRRVVAMKRMVHQGCVIFVTALLAGVMVQLLTLIKTGSTPPNAYKVLPVTALYSAILGPLVWSVFSVMSGWLGIRKYRVGRMSRR